MNENRKTGVAYGLIIVVDYDVAVRKSLKFSLEVEGFIVRTYARGDELLNETTLPACRCLVIDQRLPGISGIDLIEKLRNREVSAPAVLIATHPSAALQARAARAGISIVEKPLLGSNLLDSIRRITTHSELLRH